MPSLRLQGARSRGGASAYDADAAILDRRADERSDARGRGHRERSPERHPQRGAQDIRAARIGANGAEQGQGESEAAATTGDM